MAEIENKQQEPQAAGSQMQTRPCPKDCRKCSMAQQICCSSILSFRMYDVMNNMIQRLEAQTAVIADMAGRLAALQSEAELAAPQPVEGALFKEKA